MWKIGAVGIIVLMSVQPASWLAWLALLAACLCLIWIDAGRNGTKIAASLRTQRHGANGR